MASLLTLNNITTGYGKRIVLHDVSFRLNEGEIKVLIGSNGAGKSTLLRTIYGLNPLWKQGDILFCGQRIDGTKPEQLIKKGIAYIPQKGNTFSNMTVMENLQTAAWTIGKNIISKRIEEAIKPFEELACNKTKKAADLSGGQRQLLALCMGLIHRPKLILFDEPSAGLDLQKMRLIFNEIKKMNSKLGVAFLIVEHRVKAVAEIADYFVGLKLGRLHSIIDAQKEINGKALASVFL